ncbi:MAG TPA: helix-turn-helix domain-containing protein, partial [Polyangiaceae bacterium]|nr:helix-turn-helix domain-containing protein [Polyangiaceae bacterium]
MPAWQISFSLKTGTHTHRMPEGLGHTLLFSTVASAFETLRVSAGIAAGEFWYPIHGIPSVIPFELEHGLDTDRSVYNGRQIAKARRRRAAVRGTYLGFSDLFVPVVIDGEVEAVLVVGPFLLARPTSSEIAARWRRIAGRTGLPGDPAFGTYASATLSTLVLDDEHFDNFERLMICLAGLLSGQGKADALANEAELLIVKVRQTRFVDRTWDAARSMVDDRFPSAWTSAARRSDLYNLGLPRAPDHALVGLCVSASPGTDPLVEIVRRDGLQRRAVDLAYRHGEQIAGQLGDQGVFFLSCTTGTLQRKKQKLGEWAERIGRVARRDFGQAIHFGAGVPRDSAPLSFAYQWALGAAESAIAQGTNIVFAEPAKNERYGLAELRRELAHAVEEQPDLVAARFQRYLEAIALRSGYDFQAASAHLEAGFERMTEALVQNGALDQKRLAELGNGLSRECAGARSMSELFEIYRDAAKGLARAMQSPSSARQDHALERGLEYVQEHYAERLSLPKVARVAGFAPAHFSRLFSRRTGTPFVEYVAGLRLERAKHLLGSTKLDVTRVAKRSGFNSVQYFCRVFRQS